MPKVDLAHQELTSGRDRDGAVLTSPIGVVFATGPADLNRQLIDRFTAARPDLALYVVGEFEPHCGHWIPYHVRRGFGANLASIRAATGPKRIEAAAMVLAPGTKYAKLRWIAIMLGHRVLTAYDEDLQVVRGAGFFLYFVRRVVQALESERSRKWLRRILHPSEAEIPIRTRAAQIRGIVASYVRFPAREVPMRGAGPLAEGVSVVIPSRDGRELLERLLPGLVPQVIDGEIIVSDNGSTDGTATWLAEQYPAIQVIQSDRPLSFSRAVNTGIAAARFTRVLLLNNDMIVRDGFIDALESAFASVPDLFCATAQIFFPSGIRREETGKAVWRRENRLDFPVRCDDPAAGEDLTWVLYGSGGCSLFDTSKLRQLGGISEAFDPAYVEDLDLGYRAWKRGWPSVYCAQAQVEHRHRATTSRFYSAREMDAFVERNYLRFLTHAIASPGLFRCLWLEGIRRLELMAMNGNSAALDTLRSIPAIGRRPPHPFGVLSETEILSLGAGDVAVFPGRGGVCENTRRGTLVIASPYLPFPLSHGGAVRIYNLIRHAAPEWDRVLIAFADELAQPPAELLDLCREIVIVRRHGSHYRQNTPRPDVVEEFNSEAFKASLKQTVRRWRPQVVQLEFTQMAQYAADTSPAKTILVEHDITLDLQQQLLRASGDSGAARWELETQLRKWKEFETTAWSEVDCVVTMSSKDARMVEGARSVACLPNGVDTGRFQPSAAVPEPRRLLFIGSFAHQPNLLALEFFLREVWPLVGSGYTLHVIGGMRHEYFLDLYRRQGRVELNRPGIELEGFVSDVRNAYSRAELVLAPLTASAGSNIKVLEAMAMGRVVVSTPAGINGLELAPGEEVVVAKSAMEMAQEIQSLCCNAARRREIEAHAREAARRYDWREIAKAQSDLYRRLTRS